MPKELTIADIQNARQGEGLVDPATGLEGGAKSTASPLSISDIEEAKMHSQYGGNDAYLGKGDLGLNPSEYDFQLRYGADNDEIRAQSQSAAGMFLKGGARLVGSTFTKLMAGLGYAGTAIPAIINQDMNVMLDNGFSAMWNSVEDELKEALPIYKTRAYLEGNVLEQMGTLGFWMDDVVDGAAFMLSSIVGTKGLGALGKSTKAYSTLAKNASRALAAARSGKNVGKEAIRLKSLADQIGMGTLTTINSVSEAAFEAKDIKDQIMERYHQAIEDGKQIRTFDIPKMWGLGTPEDLKYYLENYGK